MKPPTTIVLFPIAFSIALASCETMHPPPGGEYGMTVMQNGPEKFGYQGTHNPKDDRPKRKAQPEDPDSNGINRRNPDDPNSMENSATTENGIVKPRIPTPGPVETTDPIEPIEETTDPVKPKPKSPATKVYPMAELVPGKSGVVFSPYVSGKKVSIEGFKPGDLAECPWSGKPFRVP